MPTSRAKQPPFTNTVLGACAVLNLFGMAGLVLTATLAFEEPNAALLLVSSLLLFAVPIAVLMHLVVTRELSRQEKRIWIQQLTGGRAPWAFSDYLTSPDRRATAKRLAEETATRGPAKSAASCARRKT
jgi:hypothetical protein